MAWIEVHQSLVHHRKTIRLAKELGTHSHRAIGLLVGLWCWALDNAPDGDLSHITPDEIAQAVEWHRNGEVVMRALKTAGFVDPNGMLHDWDEYAGRLMDRRKADAERKRAIRRTSGGRPVDIRGTK